MKNTLPNFDPEPNSNYRTLGFFEVITQQEEQSIL